MTPPTHAISPLRQRMIDDMRMRQACPQDPGIIYLHVVRSLPAFSGAHPTRPPSRTCAAINCIWSTRHLARVAQRAPSRH